MEDFKKFVLCVGLTVAVAFIAVCLFMAFLYQIYVAYGLAAAGVLAAVRWLVLPVVRQSSEIVLSWRQPQAHVIRDGRNGEQTHAIIYDGQIIRIGEHAQAQYDPQVILQLIRQQVVTTIEQEYDIVDEENPGVQALLPAPAMYKLSDQLKSEATTLGEETSIVGYVDGQALRGTLFAKDGNMMDSIYVAGDSGTGKSCLAVYLAALCILQHGKILVIDPDFDLDQSLTKRLGPLCSMEYLLAPVGTDPEKAMVVLDKAAHTIKTPPDHPVLLLMDEFSMIMRDAETKGEWGDVGIKAANIAENFATRGRKRRLKCVVFGQITNATRSGGTELRNSMTTFVFRLKKSRAQIVLEDAEESAVVPTLKDGEAFVVPARSSANHYRMQVPFPDGEGLQMVIDLLEGNASGNKIIHLISTRVLETGWKQDGNEIGNEFPEALQARLNEIENWQEKLAKMEELGPYADRAEIWQAIFQHAPGGRSHQKEAAIFKVLAEAGRYNYQQRRA